jgi:GT2 family glycosyltransferase
MGDMTSHHVSISICAFNNISDVQRCVSALSELDYENFEIVICENGSLESYNRLVDVLPGSLPNGQSVKVIWGRTNRGFAGGVNTCIGECREADAWWILNPDTQPDRGALRAMVQTLFDGEYDAVGCKIYLDGGAIQSYGGYWTPVLARAESIGHGLRLTDPVDAAAIVRKQNYLNGSSMLISRKFVDHVGLMREDYFLYCEEIEWFLRGSHKGMRLGFSSEAEVLHFTGTTTGASSNLKERSRLSVFLNTRNAILLVKDQDPLWGPVAVMALIVQILGRYGRRGAWRQVGYGLSGLVDGVLNRRGAPDWTGG